MERLTHKPAGASSAGRPFLYRPDPPMYTVTPDIPLSRRLMRHVVQDDQGGIVYEARQLADVLTFLSSREQTEFAVHAWDASYVVKLTRIPQPKEP